MAYYRRRRRISRLRSRRRYGRRSSRRRTYRSRYARVCGRRM